MDVDALDDLGLNELGWHGRLRSVEDLISERTTEVPVISGDRRRCAVAGEARRDVQAFRRS